MNKCKLACAESPNGLIHLQDPETESESVNLLEGTEPEAENDASSTGQGNPDEIIPSLEDKELKQKLLSHLCRTNVVGTADCQEGDVEAALQDVRDKRGIVGLKEVLTAKKFGTAYFATIAETGFTLHFSEVTALYIAAVKGWKEIVRAILQILGTETGEDKDLLHEVLLEKDKNYEMTPLQLACIKGPGHAQVVQLILQKVCGTELFEKLLLIREKAFKSTPLHTAASTGNIEVVKVIVEQVADSVLFERLMMEGRINGLTPLMSACELGQKEVVAFLLNKMSGSELLYMLLLNTNNWYKSIPLHSAATYGRTAVFELILEKASGNELLEKMLLARNIAGGWTALHEAARRGHVQLVELALQKYISRDIQLLRKVLSMEDANGRTLVDTLAAATLTEYMETVVNAYIRKGKPMPSLEIVKEKWQYREVFESHSWSQALIQTCPVLMKSVLDDCVSFVTVPPKASIFGTSSDYGTSKSLKRVVVDFTALDDYSKPQPENNKQNDFKKNSYTLIPGIERFWCAGKFSNNLGQRTKPLENIISSRHDMTELVTHPVTETLVEIKWQKYGRFYYYLELLIFIFFLSLLIAFEYERFDCFSRNKENNNCNEINIRDMSIRYSIPGALVFCMSAFRLVLEVYDLYTACTYSSDLSVQSTLEWDFVFSRLKEQEHSTWFNIIFNYMFKHIILPQSSILFQRVRRYLSDIENITELALYISAIIFTTNIFGGGVLQWHVGICCVILAFFNLILILQPLPNKVGLYCIIFRKILKNFLPIIPHFLLFSLAFVVLFNMVSFNITFTAIFHDVKAFGNSLFWVLSRSGTGIEHGDLSDLNDRPGESAYTLLSLLLFLLIMNFILVNLATGLAISDVEKVIKDSEAEKIIVKIKHILKVDRGFVAACGRLKTIFSIKQYYLLKLEFFNDETLKMIEKIQAGRIIKISKI